MRTLIVASALLLAGCADVRDTEISTIDFSDSASVQEIAQELTPKERQAFGLYAMNRMASGAMGGKEITRPDGSAPETVAEAIELATARMDLREKRLKLIDEKNALVGQLNENMDNTYRVIDQEKHEKLSRQIDDLEKRIAESY